MLYILTLTWNGQDKLTKLKESIMPALDGVDYTWLIKDNASTDQTVEVASQWGDKVKCIPYKNNIQNFSAGMNFLFNEASPADNDLVLLLNNDVIVNDNNTIQNMVEIINNDDSVGVVGSRLLYTGTDKLQHAGVVFDNRNGMPTHFRCKEVTDKNSKKNRLFQVVTGAVLLTRAQYYRNIFNKNKSSIGGMDENYHWAFDDVDLCLSIKYNMEKKVVYCGKNDVFHEESASLKKVPANRLFMNHNCNYLLSKWRGRYSIDKDIYSRDPSYNLYKE
jgi:O-antigen biosynthesis protein